jgi:hypothetical protein
MFLKVLQKGCPLTSYRVIILQVSQWLLATLTSHLQKLPEGIGTCESYVIFVESCQYSLIIAFWISWKRMLDNLKKHL